MMLIIIAAATYIVLTFAFALFWNLGIFKARYHALAGDVLRAEPIIPLGLAAIVGNTFVILALFSLLYPAGEVVILRGIFLSLLASLPNITYGAFVVPAKISVAKTTDYVMLELAYGVIGVVLTGAALALVFGYSA
jgi:hypothetical protein